MKNLTTAAIDRKIKKLQQVRTNLLMKEYNSTCPKCKEPAKYIGENDVHIDDKIYLYDVYAHQEKTKSGAHLRHNVCKSIQKVAETVIEEPLVNTIDSMMKQDGFHPPENIEQICLTCGKEGVPFEHSVVGEGSDDKVVLTGVLHIKDGKYIICERIKGYEMA